MLARSRMLLLCDRQRTPEETCNSVLAAEDPPWAQVSASVLAGCLMTTGFSSVKFHEESCHGSRAAGTMAKRIR